MPKRIQRKRVKGWRMPAGAVYVGRPSRWGNYYYGYDRVPASRLDAYSRIEGVEAYRTHLQSDVVLLEAARQELAGKEEEMCPCLWGGETGAQSKGGTPSYMYIIGNVRWHCKSNG